MGKVILLTGPHGVGKTSVLNVARKLGELLVYEGFKINPKNYDLDNINDFRHYQKLYLKKSSKICKEIHGQLKNGIVLRSIEESSFYYFVKKNSKQMMEIYEKDVVDNKYVGADYIIYLYATKNILKKRCEEDDTRDMKATKCWYRDYYYQYDKFWRQYPGVIIIDTSKLSPEGVYEKVKETCNE